MGEYILRLLILLPLLGGMAWASLWFWKKLQEGTPLVGAKRPRAMDLVSVLPIGPGTKLAIVEFAGQQILIAVSRNGVTRIASDAQGDFHVD
jgi:flagellar protein FliO/FliZ